MPKPSHKEGSKFEPSHVGCCLRAARTGNNYLPRLPRDYYLGNAVVHWSMPVAMCAKGWLTDALHRQFRELLLHTAAREGLLCPMYCLMPDHLHLMWMGLRFDTDQLNATAFLRTHLEPLLAPAHFQHQAHDHVLKTSERRRGAFASVCSYILNNPVKAELVELAEDWLFSGAVVPGYPALHPFQRDFWVKFWKLYSQSLHPDAGSRNLPPI